MKLLIILFTLLAAILASPQGYFGGGRGGTIPQIPGQRVYGVSGPNVGSQNFGLFERWEGNGGLSTFNEHGIPVPGTNGAVQREQLKNGRPGEFGDQRRYDRTNSQENGQNEGLNGINNEGGIYEWPVYRCIWCAKEIPFRTG